MAKKSMRRYWLAVHLYFGLLFGFFFALAGITGTILVFYPELDRAINSELVVDKFDYKNYQFQPVLDKLNNEFPDYKKSWRIEAPLDVDRAIFARYYKPKETEHLHFAPLMVALDPNKLELINTRFWGNYFVTWIYDLHYSLLMGHLGKTIMSILALFYLVMLLVGVYLWLPKNDSVFQKIKIKWRPHIVRKIYDIHSLSGIYAVAFLFILVVTGLVLSTPQWVTPAIDQISMRFKKPDVASVLPARDTPRISADEAIAIAKKEISNSGLRWIETPDGINGVYVIRLKQDFEPSNRFPKSMVWVDQYSGSVLAIRNPMTNGVGDTFLDWQHPLHNGEAFGFLGRLLVAISGLIPVILFITGIIRWRQKIKAKQVY